MKEKSRAKTGRKPKSDPADYKYSFRLNAGEMTLELMLLTKKVIALTEEYQKKWLQK